jgi:hypothetical protein
MKPSARGDFNSCTASETRLDVCTARDEGQSMVRMHEGSAHEGRDGEGNKETTNTHIVAAEDTDDLAVAVDLTEDPLLHVLGDCQQRHGTGSSAVSRRTFLSSG